MSWRRSIALLCTIPAVLLTAACGGPGGGGDLGSGGTGSASRAAVGSFSSLTDVVIGASCSDSLSMMGGIVQVAAFRPSTGEVVKQATISLPTGATTAYDCSDSAYLFRQMFDKNFERMAVSLYNRETGGNDVGYIDIETGLVTDLDAGRNDFVPAAQHTNAVFNPADDSIWYTESNQAIFAVDPSGGQARDTGARFKYAGQTKFVVVNGSPTITDWDSRDIILPSPSGNVVAHYGDSETTLGGSDFTFMSDATARTAQFVLKADDGRSPSRHVPVLWINETHLITTVDISSMSAPAAQSLALLQTAPDHRSLFSYQLLLPQTDRHNFAPMVSPDGSTLMFISSRQQKAVLYTLNLGTKGAQPVESAIPSVPIGLLIDWR